MIVDISKNASDFAANLIKAGVWIKGDAEKVIGKTILDLYVMIADETPHNTGRARANWMIGGRLGSEVDEGAEGSKASTLSLVKERAGAFKFSFSLVEVVIYNNLVYIEALEDGWSGQAPSGMVAVSLRTLNQKLKQNLRDFEIFS